MYERTKCKKVETSFESIVPIKFVNDLKEMLELNGVLESKCLSWKVILNVLKWSEKVIQIRSVFKLTNSSKFLKLD